MHIIGVTYIINAGHEDEAAALLSRMIPLTRAEPGNLLYLAHRATDDPRRFFLYEQYTDEAALQAHRDAPYFKEIIVGGLYPLVESRTPVA